MIPELNSDQHTAPLNSIAEIIMGQAPKGDTYNVTGNGLALIAGAADLGKITPAPKKWTTSPTKIGLSGDIIVCVRATIGDLNWADKSYCYGRGVAALRVRQEHDQEFIWYWLEACKKHLLSLGRGATFKQISKENLASIPVPVMSLSEQRRIVARIKECMGRVDEFEYLRKESISERSYLGGSLIEAELAGVEGEEVAIADVCEIVSRLIDPREDQYQSMLHVGGANIESKTGRLINVKTAAEEKLKSGKFVFDETMVLYNKIRPYLMKTARPDFSGLCSADMYPLTPKTGKATRDFIYYILMSRSFIDYAISGSNRAGMPKVNRKHLFAYRFKLPTLIVQQQICENLDSAVEAVHLLGQEMSSAEMETTQLREAILRKAFAGEL